MPYVERKNNVIVSAFTMPQGKPLDYITDDSPEYLAFVESGKPKVKDVVSLKTTLKKCKDVNDLVKFLSEYLFDDKET